MFLYQKKLLRKIDPEKNWTEWFDETYGSSNLRSAQDYMRMANTPNIIRYAVFGRERLMEILRAILHLRQATIPLGISCQVQVYL
jgi:phage anti-repressor protein